MNFLLDPNATRRRCFNRVVNTNQYLWIVVEDINNRYTVDLLIYFLYQGSTMVVNITSNEKGRTCSNRSSLSVINTGGV